MTTIELITLIIGLACVTNIWCISTPTIALRESLGITRTSKFKAVSLLAEMFECAMCSGYWLGFIFFFFKINLEFQITIMYSVIYGAIVSILSELIYKKLG